MGVCCGSGQILSVRLSRGLLLCAVCCWFVVLLRWCDVLSFLRSCILFVVASFVISHAHWLIQSSFFFCCRVGVWC